MRTAPSKQSSSARSHRPRAVTVFAAAFVAGAAAAVGVNRALDVRLAQSKPRVESEAIFVALRSLPQGSPVTVWDVALRDWPKAMMPASALRASDTFTGSVLKHPLREGQPLLSIQLVPAAQGSQPAGAPSASPPPAAYTQISSAGSASGQNATESDLWAPAEPVQKSVQKTTHPTPAPTPQPVQALPVATPLAAHSQPTEPIVAEPSISEPSISEPSISEPSIADAETFTPETVAVESATQEPARQEAIEPEPAVSETVAPGAVAVEVVPSGDTIAADTTSAVITASPIDALPATIAPPTEPAVSATITAAPVTPPSPLERPRINHSRFLVVPERIAVKADNSFVTPAPAPQQSGATSPAMPQTTQRSASNDVRPLPPTTTTERVGRTQPQGKAPARPHRHGRQDSPVSPAAPTAVPPQPRLGAAMFPNISAGVGAVESRLLGTPPDQGRAPAASRPLTAR